MFFHTRDVGGLPCGKHEADNARDQGLPFAGDFRLHGIEYRLKCRIPGTQHPKRAAVSPHAPQQIRERRRHQRSDQPGGLRRLEKLERTPNTLSQSRRHSCQRGILHDKRLTPALAIENTGEKSKRPWTPAHHLHGPALKANIRSPVCKTSQQTVVTISFRGSVHSKQNGGIPLQNLLKKIHRQLAALGLRHFGGSPPDDGHGLLDTPRGLRLVMSPAAGDRPLIHSMKAFQPHEDQSLRAFARSGGHSRPQRLLRDFELFVVGIRPGL